MDYNNNKRSLHIIQNIFNSILTFVKVYDKKVSIVLLNILYI